ncbi:TRAP transporter large permease [Pelagibacterium flavum]|uniref:TRAP transporter large permease protein n=1 Tax=Pelagibacterium flavum TaxID=2984530 RepID=A0ABY6INS0_9HYPH|nr:TRAP transporter large permease [Pelagibacterium sp. YIM 151497]UYQ70905.1 TRAP transporter large permease [Pelagibacterium sp. YIM 151497]
MFLLFASLIFLMLIGTPVFAAIGAASLLYMFANGLNPLVGVQRMVAGVDSFTLLAVPFFIFAGLLMNASQVTTRLFNFANSMVAHWRGGLGHVNVYGSLIFSMMSGSAMADAAGLGSIQLKAMKERGYDTGFAVGTTAATTILAGVIPPSLALVVYGFVANVSVGQLFLAGILPGLLCALFLHIAIFVYATTRGMPAEPRHSWLQRGQALIQGVPALLLPVIIIGSIAAGIATPTEAAAIASAYALILGVVFYRTLDLRGIGKVLVETFELTATILIMVAASMLFGWILVYENVARDLTQLLVGFADETWQLTIILVLLLLVCGMFLDNLVVILITTPILMPVVLQYGIDPTQFGIIMVMTVMIGLMTPPIGMALFVVTRIAGMPYMKGFMATLPFLVPVLLVILLVITVPQISLALPQWLMR